jgi:hypothetical protein
MPRSWRIPSFLLVLVMAAAAGWLPRGSSGIPDFDHLAHIAALGEKESCRTCHADPSRPKTRESSTPCATCHGEMAPGTAAPRYRLRDSGAPSRPFPSGEGQTQPVGLGRPATLQAPLAGPEGNIS